MVRREEASPNKSQIAHSTQTLPASVILPITCHPTKETESSDRKDKTETHAFPPPARVPEVNLLSNQPPMENATKKEIGGVEVRGPCEFNSKN